MNILERLDPEVMRIIHAEEQRQTNTLELIASENHASPAVLAAMGSVLTDKYAEGYPGHRCYCGCEAVDDIETLALQRGKELFGAEHVNVQPHSGTSANLAVYLAALKPGSKILGMDLAHGGHLSHGMSINLSGILYNVVSYGIEPDSEQLDMDHVRQIALKEKPDMIIAGASAYPRQIDFETFGHIADEVGCPLLSDVAHIAGLIVGGVHPDPVPHSTFVTGTTHKTLRGPRGGFICCRADWSRAIDRAIFPGIQGGPLMHIIAAKAVCFAEASKPEFATYAAAVIENAKILAEALAEKGWRLVSGGTDNHLMLIDLKSKTPDLTGEQAANLLAQANLIANTNPIPFDPPQVARWTGVRFGTPALTTRGLGPKEMVWIAEGIDQILTSGGRENVLAAIRGGVAEIGKTFPIPQATIE